MKKIILLFLSLACCAGRAHSQSSAAIATFNINNVLYVDGVKYPLTAAGIQAAVNDGGKNAHVVLPPGTISVSVESASIFVYDGDWISGAGEYATTIRRANGGITNHSIFAVAPGGGYGSTGNVTFSDFAIDGNKENQSGGSSLIGGGNVSGLTVQRMRLLNAWDDAIGLYPTTTTTESNILIEDGVFSSNGHSSSLGFDIQIRQPSHVQVLRNTFLNSVGIGAIGFSSNTGAGNVEVGENVFTGFTGFGVALGGGSNGGSSTASSGATIHDNTFTSGPGANENAVDLAQWSDSIVQGNHFYMTLGGLSAIADLPPAFNVIVDGNVIYANAGSTTTGCLGLGGSDVVITNNFCQGAGGSGIVYAVATGSSSTHVLIANNITKNNNQASLPPSFYHKGGIELFLSSGSTVSEVTITGNHAYDDQASPTQSYGIELANGGQTVGFGDIDIENNDVRHNATAGVENGMSGATGFEIRNNPGWNPKGAISTPSFPSSANPYTNSSGYDLTVYISTGIGVTVSAIAIGGTALSAVELGASATSGPIRVLANQTIMITYSGGTPSWQWIAD